MKRLVPSFLACARVLLPPGAAVASPPLVFFLAAVVALLQLPANLLMRAGQYSAGILTNELIVVAGVPLAMIWWQRFDRRRLLPFARLSPLLVVLLLLFMLGATILIDYATAASERVLPLPEEIQAIFDAVMAAGTTPEVVWKCFVLCIVPGVCEELFFRGFCQASLVARWGNTMGVIAAAALFAMLHGNPSYFHLYFALGLVFGWAFAATGSLWASILCHVFNNAWTFLHHVYGGELPLEGVPWFVNMTIAAGGAVLFVAATMMIRKAVTRHS
jgi:membrane protease YdiL (CAAX protease family)